jgi:TRAP-type C4-dicarboxylate transport system substrate-binding protein
MKKLTTLTILLTFILSIAVLGSSFAVAADKTIVWKLNDWALDTHITHGYLKRACDEIYKRSEGRLRIDIYPAFSLRFNPATWLSDHKDGIIDISVLFDMYTCGAEPSFCVNEASIFRTPEQQIRTVEALDEFKKRVYKDAWNTVFLAGGVIPGPRQGVICTTEGHQLKRLEDLKGLKIRVATMRSKELWGAFEAAPQFMPKSEVYMALKTGVVDGYESGWNDGLVTEKFYEVFKYVSRNVVAAATQQDIIVSRRVWDPLPADLKKIVQDVFREWAQETKKDALAGHPSVSDENLKILKNAGITVTDLSKEDQEKIIKTALELQESWVKSKGGRTAEAWGKIKPLIEK